MGWQVLALYSGGELFWHESFAGNLYLVSNTDTAASSSPKKITDLLYTIASINPAQ